MNQTEDIRKLLDDNKTIVILQADNPDGDSLASALALEQIFHDMGKVPHMYCGVDMPKHLRHLPGWDRVVKDIPHSFDISIMVDCSSKSLFEAAERNGQLSWVLAKPTIILDHHNVETTFQPTVNLNDHTAVATGEVIYDLAKKLDWPLDIHAMNMITVSILSDSLGLMTTGTTAKSIRTIAELVDAGVNLPELDEARRETMRKSEELVRYKGELLGRIEYHHDTEIATVTIPWEDIEKYSSSYNPSILVLEDMRLTEGTKLAIAFKVYNNGNRITAKIRCNYGNPIGKELAEHFGGGGHPYASGFKVIGRPFNEVKSECIELAHELLDKLKMEQTDAVI